MHEASSVCEVTTFPGGLEAVRPAPFSAYTTPEFWDDPHVSQRMLEHHLDPDGPAASRRHAFIDASVDWLWDVLGLTPGMNVLDLGCGPGLYATRLARRGARVLGIDVSRRSLAHLREVTDAEGLPIEARRANYLDAELGDSHHAAILIYEDYSVLSPDQRRHLLARVADALRPGGQIVFDVTAASRFDDHVDSRRDEPNLMGGFWAPPPYRGVHETWTYPELRLVLDRYTIETAEATEVFWNWMHCQTPDEVRSELVEAGFDVLGLYGDVAGAPHDPQAPTFAVHAVRD